MVGRAEGIDALLGAAGFLVTPRTAESSIELAGIERLAQPSVFMMSVKAADPCVNGVMFSALPRGLMCSIRSRSYFFAVSSRKAIISENFQPVFTCKSGKGTRPG